MRSNPIESAPGNLYEQREINWGFANRAEMHRSPSRGWQRFGMYTALFVTAGLAMMLVPSVLTNWAGRGETEGLFVAGSTPVATQRSPHDAANSSDSAIKHQLAAEQERQRGEVLAHQLALAREDVGTLTARVTALTDERTEAEKALQTAQASAAEQKLALEQERQRGETLLRELASAREEVEARKAAVNAADASAKNAQASATEQTQAAEQERQRGEVLAHQLASAQVDVGTLTARVTALTDERSEAEKALQTAQASAAEQKLALEQERQRGDTLLRELASAREEVEARKAAVNAADASAKNAHTSRSAKAVLAGGSSDTDIGSGSSTAALKVPALPTPQKSEPVWPNPPGAVSAPTSDNGLEQAPEMAPPASMRSGPSGAGQSLRDLSRPNPPERLIGRGYRDLNRFPDYSQTSSRIRDFANRGMPRRQGDGIGTRRQNYSSIRLFGD